MRFGIAVLGLTTILFGGYGIVRNALPPQATSDTRASPLILEKSEGEHRVRRPKESLVPRPGDTRIPTFTIKIDRKNGGSQKMWLGTEDIPPGGLIPKHKHLGQDEMLLIQTGTAHVWLGSQERDVHAGAIVFIPSDTWISLKNTGNESISLVFVFSDPGFDDYMRCSSVPAGDPSSTTVLPRDELKDCQHKGHATFEGFDSTDLH
jgi:quercetin dioxygenase-like cupin family protein